MDRFDQVANKVICINNNSTDREKQDPSITQITAIEHEFKFHEGIWSLTLKDANIKSDNFELNIDALKLIAVTMDQNVQRRKKKNVTKRITKS